MNGKKLYTTIVVSILVVLALVAGASIALAQEAEKNVQYACVSGLITLDSTRWASTSDLYGENDPGRQAGIVRTAGAEEQFVAFGDCTPNNNSLRVISVQDGRTYWVDTRYAVLVLQPASTPVPQATPEATVQPEVTEEPMAPVLLNLDLGINEQNAAVISTEIEFDNDARWAAAEASNTTRFNEVLAIMVPEGDVQVAQHIENELYLAVSCDNGVTTINDMTQLVFPAGTIEATCAGIPNPINAAKRPGHFISFHTWREIDGAQISWSTNLTPDLPGFTGMFSGVVIDGLVNNCDQLPIWWKSDIDGNAFYQPNLVMFHIEFAEPLEEELVYGWVSFDPISSVNVAGNHYNQGNGQCPFNVLPGFDYTGFPAVNELTVR